jgi:hypothetical protein
MSAGLSNLEERLAKVEQQISFRAAQQERLSRCICRKQTVIDENKPDEFEEEIDRKCAIHDFRELGEIVRVGVRVEKKSEKLDMLLQCYKLGRPPFSIARSLKRAQIRAILKHAFGEI